MQISAQLLAPSPYLCVGGGDIDSDDDKNRTEDQAGSQCGTRAPVEEEKGAHGSESKDGTDPDVFSNDSAPAPGYHNVHSCCPETRFGPSQSKLL